MVAAIVGGTLPDPFIDRLPHLLFLRIIKGLQRRPGEGTLKGRQGGADDFDPTQVCPIDQLLITSDDFLHSDRFFRRRQKRPRPSDIVDALHDHHVRYAWLAQHVAVGSSTEWNLTIPGPSLWKSAFEVRRAASICARRSWPVSREKSPAAELVERLKNLGVSASRAGVTGALAELELELELSNWAPWRLVERGSEWVLAPKSELLELLSGLRGLPVKEARTFSQEHKAVLLVVIGYRRKGGVTKSRVGTILGLEASTYLADLAREGLIYCDPSRELNFWRPAPEALLALGLRAKSDIPALEELEAWFDTQKEIRA